MINEKKVPQSEIYKQIRGKTLVWLCTGSIIFDIFFFVTEYYN